MNNLNRKINMKLSNLLLIFVLAASLAGAGVKNDIQKPQGKYQDVYNAAFALYASSEQAGIENKFICSAEAIKKVKDGYELLSAGHCTPANPDLPEDMTFAASEQMGGKLMPVVLVKAELNDALDYSIFYMPTKNKYAVDELGNEKDAHVGDETVDVNFSFGLAKELSPGLVASKEIDAGCSDKICPEFQGLFEVQMFGAAGASGSAVVDEETGKVIGILVAGINGRTLPVFVEPISGVERAIAGVKVPPAPGAKADVSRAPDALTVGE